MEVEKRSQHETGGVRLGRDVVRLSFKGETKKIVYIPFIT